MFLTEYNAIRVGRPCKAVRVYEVYVCTELVRAGVVSGEWGETRDTNSPCATPSVSPDTSHRAGAGMGNVCTYTDEGRSRGPLSHDIPVTTPRGVCAPRGPEEPLIKTVVRAEMAKTGETPFIHIHSPLRHLY